MRDAMEGLPRWLAPVLYAGVTLYLFREFVFSDLMLIGQDTLALGYVARAFFADALRTTGFPLWNPHILGGTPFLESLAGGDSLYPPSVLLLLATEPYRALGWKLVLHVFLAGCFMYLWARALERSRGAAFVSGLAFMMAPFLVSLVFPGHDGKIFVTALTPLQFLVVERFVRSGSWAAGAGVGGVVALVILTTHFQMAYFLFGAVGLYAAVRTVQMARSAEGDARSGLRTYGWFVAFSVVGAGAAGLQLLPAVDYVTEHSRRTMTTNASDPAMARAYSASWSLHPEEVVSLAVPEFVGNSAGGAPWATGTYWGRNPFKSNHEYLGLVAILLAAVSFSGGPSRGVRWTLGGLGLFALLFSLGANTPVWGVMYELLPGVSLFRAPSIAIFVTGFAVASLAAFGVDRAVALVEDENGGRLVRTSLVAPVLLGVCWLAAATGVLFDVWTFVFPGGVAMATPGALDSARPHIARGFLISALLASSVVGVFYLLHRGRTSERAKAVAWGALAVLAGLVAVDEARIDAPFVRTAPYENYFGADGNDEFLVERSEAEDPFRVFSFRQGGEDVRPAAFGLDLAGGHHPNDLGRYRELIGAEAGSGAAANLLNLHPNVLRTLNVRYLLWPDADYGPFPIEGVEPVSQLRFQTGEPASSVYAYPGLPRARLVGDALVVPEDETLAAVLDETRFDPAVQVVLSADPEVPLAGTISDGSVDWVVRTPNRLVLDVSVSDPAVLVVSENWMPGWGARVDGVEVDVLRADHTLRAVSLPGGEHRVELSYSPPIVTWSLVVSALCTLLLGLSFGIDPWLARRRPSLAEAP